MPKRKERKNKGGSYSEAITSTNTVYRVNQNRQNFIEKRIVIIPQHQKWSQSHQLQNKCLDRQVQSPLPEKMLESASE